MTGQHGFIANCSDSILYLWRDYLSLSFLYKKGGYIVDKREWAKKAEENGIKKSIFYDRVWKLGWSLEKASTVPAKQRRKDQKWMKVAKENNISYELYINRVTKLGWDFEEAATTPKIYTGSRYVRPDEEWVQLGLKNGVSRDTYRHRVDENFWSPENAATTPPLSTKEISEIGKEAWQEYKEILDEQKFNDPNNLFDITPQHIKIAEKNGIQKKTVQSRVYASGWTVQEAITIPLRNKLKGNIDGFDYYFKKAEENGVHPITFYSRIRLGKTLKEASEMSIKTITEEEKEWREAATKNGISQNTYYHRVNYLGWSKLEASTLPPLKPGEFLNENTKARALEGWEKFRGLKRESENNDHKLE